MIEWTGFSDPRTGVPVYSLYGEVRRPTAEMLADVDVLVFDMQDVGTRVYTLSTRWLFAMARSRSRQALHCSGLPQPDKRNGH
jgi:uncharacterized protein YbbC (DUF1343 family)